MKWFVVALKKYAVFTGRVRRSEYWWFNLMSTLMLLVCVVLDAMLGFAGPNGEAGLLYLLCLLFVLVPSLSVTVRRLHDTGKSGWWLLIVLIPLVNLILFVFMLQNSFPGVNQYGPNPKSFAGARF